MTKDQFCYKMDDGNLISKYLLEPNFLRELYLFELATTIALIREDMLTTTDSFIENSGSDLDKVIGSNRNSTSAMKRQRRKSGRKSN